MECTQRLECTQELYSTQTEKTNPEQIGFLGICGQKYAVNRGPNKIGRDPQTCSIVLNLNSISRQHAVINVLNQREYMLMDLDSANKTKLVGKTLQPFIPNPLKDGDTVQFGDIFGIFRLLEEDNDLPMTQAIDIPDTPVFSRHASRIHPAVTTIPESPDVSDRDDSFIIPSQPKANKFKSPSNKFIKQSSKTISIQPIGSNKIDNVYWNSSKKSSSLHLDDSNTSLNDSVRSESDKTIGNQSNTTDIHEMETQPPVLDESTDSIYTAATQVPEGCDLSIHDLDTQLPTNEHLPVVRKINDQHEMQFDLYAANKENDKSIFNAETQMVTGDQDQNKIMKAKIKDTSIFDAETQMVTEIILEDEEIPSNNESIFNAETQLVTADKKRVSVESKNSVKDKSKSFVSDDEILFDEVDSQPILDDFYSQPLLPQEDPTGNPTNDEDVETLELSQRVVEDTQKIKPTKRNVRITSDSSTDCEDFDMLPTQQIPPKPIDDDVLTDCEDDLIDVDAKQKPRKVQDKDKDVSFEDMATQVIPNEVVITKSSNNPNVNPVSKEKETNFEDMLTQVIPEDDDVDFEDLPTQVLDEVVPKLKLIDEDQYSEELISPFKVPMQTPRKSKKKEIISAPSDNVPIKQKSPVVKASTSNTNDKYYEATQEIIDDLSTQRESSPETVKVVNSNTGDKYYAATQEIVDDLSTQSESSPEIVRVKKTKLKETNSKQQLQNELSSNEKCISKQLSESDGEENVSKYVASLSSKQIRTVIGVDSPVDTVRRVPSDPSDVELTPKKVRPIKLMLTELPDSQEIKTSVSTTSKSFVTESSSDSDGDHDVQENTPILYRNRKRPNKVEAKKDLSKNFDAQSLPSRVITRVRIPTFKFQDGDKNMKKLNESILKSKIFPDQERDVSNDIITENISRLKIKKEKKTNKDTVDLTKLDKVKKQNEPIPNEDTTVDLTKLDEVKKEDKPRPKSKEIEVIELIDSPKKSSEKNARDTKKKSIDEKSTSKSESRTSHNKSNEKNKSSKETNKTDKTERDKSQTKSKETRKDSKSKKETKSKTKEESTTSKPNDSKTSATSERKSNESTVSEPNTRSRRSKRDDKQSEKKSVTPEKGVKRKRGRPQLTDSEDEPRRSRRQKAKSEVEDKKDTKVLITKTHEQSAVYNLSTESNVDSPKNLKRSAASDIKVPSPKRTRSALRATPARAQRTHYMLFTAFPCDEVATKLEKLGAVKVTDVAACTVVLTLQIKRTFKLLCAVGLGKPIVGPEWVQACVDTNTIVDPWLYLMKDEASEKRFQFDLAATLASKRNFLQGYNVSCTPKVMPNASEMKLIVECSGGAWKEKGPRWVCVSCAADRAAWPALAQRGATIVSTEFILSGVLRQKLEIERNRLYK